MDYCLASEIESDFDSGMKGLVKDEHVWSTVTDPDLDLGCGCGLSDGNPALNGP